jgi:hypothetical protein
MFCFCPFYNTVHLKGKCILRPHIKHEQPFYREGRERNLDSRRGGGGVRMRQERREVTGGAEQQINLRI